MIFLKISAIETVSFFRKQWRDIRSFVKNTRLCWLIKKLLFISKVAHLNLCQNYQKCGRKSMFLNTSSMKWCHFRKWWRDARCLVQKYFFLLDHESFMSEMEWAPFKCLFYNANGSVVKLMISIYRRCFFVIQTLL